MNSPCLVVCSKDAVSSRRPLAGVTSATSAVALAFVVGLGLADPARAETVVLTPFADTSLMSAAPNANNGKEAWLLAGTTQNFTKTRALFRFDLTSVIPAGSIVESVQLQVEVTRQPADGFNPAPFGLFRMLRPWGEGNKVAIDNAGGLGAPAEAGEATWNERFFGGEAWDRPGGSPDVDFSSEISSEEFIYGVGDSPYFFRSTETFVSDVQGWVNDPSANHGWMLATLREDLNFTARRFGSREDENVPLQLTVQFRPVPEPGATMLLGGAVLALAGLRWLRTTRRPGRW